MREAVTGCLADDPFAIRASIAEYIPLGAHPKEIQRFELGADAATLLKTVVGVLKVE
jgi:hypothetical protein